MRTTKENKTNMSTPEHPMTESEFLSFIKEGEKGPFISSSAFKKKFDDWRSKLK